MRISKSFLCLLSLIALLIAPIADATDQQRRQAKRIHDRLTGVPASNAIIDQMETLLQSDPTGKTAADLAMQNSAFYNVTLKNFISPWTNEEQTVFVPLNDYTATAIGLIRDGVDFREILSGNVIYTGNSSSLGITPYANNNNAHYEELESLGPVVGNLADSSILQNKTQTEVTGLADAATAGIMTTRAAAQSFFSDGTNRAMFRFTLMNHLCTDLEPLKDITRTPDRIRQDVSRSPGGDSRIFLNSCVGCHAGMDGLAGAFAHYEWDYTGDKETGVLIYNQSEVQAKHLINENNFNAGYIIDDDSWINYWRNGPNSILGNRPGDSDSGWGHAAEILDDKNNAIGTGAKSMGIELANSKAFAQCQVDKVFQAICFRNPNDYSADRTERDNIVNNLKGSYNYDMREVFSDVAGYCKGS